MAIKELESKLVIQKKIYDSETSEVFLLDDGRVYKRVKPYLLNLCAMSGVDYEAKILSTCASSVKEIVSPITACYVGRICTGYTMEDVIGLNYNEFDNVMTMEQRCSLEHYYEFYKKLEDIVNRGHKVGIVMPDLASCDNIILQGDGSLRLIDYDGMQFGKKDKSIAFSTSLEHIREYLFSSKFTDGYSRFTKELDITSLTILMFLDIFNVNLNTVGMMNPFTREVVTLDYIFDTLGLEDDILKRKVSDNLSLNKRGTFITEDIRRLIDKYDMMAFKIPSHIPANSDYKKILIRK